MYTNPVGEFDVLVDAPRGVELPAFRRSERCCGARLLHAYKGKWHLSVINQKVGKNAFPDATNALELRLLRLQLRRRAHGLNLGWLRSRRRDGGRVDQLARTLRGGPFEAAASR
jgi:hypothetical protein